MLDSFLALAVLILVVGVIAWALLGRREPPEGRGRKRPAVRYRRRSPWRKRLPILLMAGASSSWGLRFTQFRLFREADSTGTVILTMDVSESMGRTDVDPSRLEAATAAARVFLENLPPDLKVGSSRSPTRRPCSWPPSRRGRSCSRP